MEKERFYVQTKVFEFGLSKSALCVYVCLCSHANAEGSCFVGRSRIEKLVGVKKTTASKVFTELSNKGLIRFNCRYMQTQNEKRRQTTNEFHVLNLNEKI